ncbi:SDR family oxidoreductase [Bradyrhizobium sp. U87765 SZCCT0131]|uniref:SDR family oxidoreductase n=1 Tax=unclassified Bradyrhizobium TaxID=2631580 RepID=UPI001BA9B214|nr:MULTISPECIES: SDR family oxidoreductase [unclassified Bradyrhizobium]MBR1222241.1 SDR family oxidoreductase [Bradyrhizobium sp. U87765 SZCCT0131]MBR1264275.1 SDR family oxidoreductase [Bradyrhizobium sp. U87765 SZCCT0134]MBR1307942.1 SDR family oxidoreductase [Bradyrhizobium sp. U87765 SZCCT0110]MBR1320525.1 SDR family oxidoreductase [Bradyrhizobium sp. U87765 SZCCT0109]MBR1348362.1 SDR family oxidoreductase [Bradyrhizobium sp. U87765 SZCCT0048]
MRSVVITGTSTGIGFAAAKALVDSGFRVFGSVRKADDGERLQRELGATFVPLVFDVTDEAAVLAGAQTVREALGGETLAGLVNNAGIAVSGPLLDLTVDEFRRQMDVNVIGVVIATKAFAPLLGADRSLKGAPGRIVMIGSVAGQHGNPLLSPYSASKFALEGLSESLRREFMLFGIDVVLIGPGAVKTPIWDKAEEIDIARFRASPFLPALERLRGYMLTLAKDGLPPEQIGALVHRVLTTPRPRVRYAVSPEPLQLLIGSLLPKRLVDRMVAKRLGLLPPRNG